MPACATGLKHTDTVRMEAIELYLKNPEYSLNRVAKILSARYKLNPPLHGDTIGRWLEQKGIPKKTKFIRCKNRWITRRKKYGKSGLTPQKMRELKQRIKKLWLDNNFRKEMSQKMRHAHLRIKFFYINGETLILVPFGNRWRANTQNLSLVDMPCFKCGLNKPLGSYCDKEEIINCQALTDYLIRR